MKFQPGYIVSVNPFLNLSRNSVEDTMEEGPCCSFDNQDDGNLSNDNGVCK